MKFKSTFLAVFFLVAAVLFRSYTATAQQYKLRQVTSTMGMKSESTIYVKGMRKRTEGGGYMGMTQPTLIEQCDLQRTIKINDKKKLYYIEPFSNHEKISEDDQKNTVVRSKPEPTPAKAKQKTGGVITMWYNVLDTGERKKMYGITARRLWTTQKMIPSPDACTMKDSMVIKTDGWYIDLPEFNCPARYMPTQVNRSSGKHQPQCMDRFVSRKSGKGKPGFPLSETKTMIMGDGSSQTSTFESTIETIEFSTGKLDSMLFEIPIGYKEARSEDELEDQPDINAMIQQAGYKNGNSAESGSQPGQANQGMIRIGVYEPETDEALDLVALQQHLVITLTGNKVQAVAVGLMYVKKAAD